MTWNFIFLISLSLTLSQGMLSVEVAPVDRLVSTLNGMAEFTCFANPSAGVISVQWFLNKTTLMGAAVQLSESGFGRLSLTNLSSNLNNSQISCMVTTNRGQYNSTNFSLLVLQGLLAVVKSPTMTQNCSSISLAWMPPYSLDILGVDPDIAGYYVDVVNLNNSELLHSEYIERPWFTYIITPPTNNLQFIITAVNVVGNGTAHVKSYVGPDKPKLVEVVLVNYNDIRFNMSFPICGVMLSLMDINTREEIYVQDADMTIYQTIISLTAQQLKENRHYNVTITAANSRGQATSNTVISTHDVKNITTINQSDTTISFKVVYHEHSTASGVIIIFVNEDAVFYLALTRHASYNTTVPLSMGNGRCAVYLHDIESDGTLASGVGYPAFKRDLTPIEIEGSSFQPHHNLLEQCSVNTSGHAILVACTSHNESTASGFQVLVRFRNSSSHKLYINQSADHQAVVVVEEIGQYQVTIYAIRKGIGIVDSKVEYNIEHLVIEDVAISTRNKTSASMMLMNNPPYIYGIIGGLLVLMVYF